MNDQSTCHKCNDSTQTVCHCCPHYVLCENCDQEDNPYFFQYVCYYCILDGNADLIESIVENECWGGNYYEICRPALVALDFGRQDACNQKTPYQWDESESAPIIWTQQSGDPRGNVACFRDLYLIGFHAHLFDNT